MLSGILTLGLLVTAVAFLFIVGIQESEDVREKRIYEGLTTLRTGHPTTAGTDSGGDDAGPETGDGYPEAGDVSSEVADGVTGGERRTTVAADGTAADLVVHADGVVGFPSNAARVAHSLQWATRAVAAAGRAVNDD